MFHSALMIKKPPDRAKYGAEQQSCTSTHTRTPSLSMPHSQRMARRSQLQGSVSPLERERLKVVSSYSARAAKAVPGGTVCPSCWCKNEVCACMPSARGATEGLHHRVLIYCHYKEYLKLSNTGALLLGILPPGQASLYVCGVPEHDEAFKAELQRSQGSSFVLYPSPESKSEQPTLPPHPRVSNPSTLPTWFCLIKQSPSYPSTLTD